MPCVTSFSGCHTYIHMDFWIQGGRFVWIYALAINCATTTLRHLFLTFTFHSHFSIFIFFVLEDLCACHKLHHHHPAPPFFSTFTFQYLSFLFWKIYALAINCATATLRHLFSVASNVPPSQEHSAPNKYHISCKRRAIFFVSVIFGILCFSYDDHICLRWRWKIS